MTKDEIIDKLLIDHDVWEAGFTRRALERMSKKQLQEWLRKLEEQ